MRSSGSPAELERRQRLAVRRIQASCRVAEVAAFLEMAPYSVRRWIAAFRQRGQRGLAARSAPGRPHRLSRTQEKIVRRWLRSPASGHGFGTEHWTGARLASLIAEKFGVGFHPSYLSLWLRARGYTPQTPERMLRERDPQAVARWREAGCPRIKKRPAARGRLSCSSTRAAC